MERNRIVTNLNDPKAHQEVTEIVLNVMNTLCCAEINPRRRGLYAHTTEEERLFLIERAEHVAKECVVDQLRKYIKCDVSINDNEVMAKIHLPLILSSELDKLKEENTALYHTKEGYAQRITRLIETVHNKNVQLEYERLPFYKKLWKALNEPFDVE